jgi:hypothetical protein
MQLLRFILLKVNLSINATAISVVKVKKKGKVVLLRSIEAHLDDRRYSSSSFLTLALEGGEWSASRPGCS